MSNGERNPNEPMRKCWLVRYDDSRFANSAFFELGHFAWASLSSHQSEQDQEDAHEALTRYMCLMMLSPNCEHPPLPRLRRKRGL